MDHHTEEKEYHSATGEMEEGTNRQDQEEKSGKKAHLPTGSVGDTDYVKSDSSSRGTSRSSAISRGSALGQLYTRTELG